MLAALLALAVAGASQDSAHLVVVATSDVQGQVVGWDYVADAPAPGGLARVATVVDSLRARYPGQVVVVDGGNALQGAADVASPFATYFGRVAPRDPHPIAEALGVVGYDAATLGARDFDLGIAGVRRALAGATFAAVSANVLAVDGDTLLSPAFVVLRRGGLRVAVAGFTSDDAVSGTARSAVRVVPAERVAARTLDDARRRADVVIALAPDALGGGAGGLAFRLALTGGARHADVVVASAAGGEGRDSTIGEVPLVQPGTGAATVAVVHLWLTREGDAWHARRATTELVATGRFAPAARVASRFATEHAAVRDWTQARVGWAAADMPAAGALVGPTPLVGFLGRVMRDRTGAQLAAVGVSDLAAGFRRGEIRRGDVLAIHAPDDTLLALRVSGRELEAYLEQAARAFHVDALGHVTVGREAAGDFDAVDGANYTIDLRAPVGRRIRALTVAGRSVEATDSFTLAIGSRRRAGAAGYAMLATAPVVYDRGEYVRDAIVDALQRRESVDPADFGEGGWSIGPADAVAALRAQLGLSDETVRRAAPRDSTVLRVAVVGDLRGRFDAVPRLEAVLDSVAAACGCGVVRLATGDAVPAGAVATDVPSVASLDLLGAVGLAGAVVGERELAWSTDTVRRRAALSGYPWLVANLVDSATGRHPAWSEPYRIVAVGDRRVAVIGYVSATTSASIGAARARGYRVGEGLLALKTVLDEVHAAKPDLVVLLAHADADDLDRLASALPRGAVDLIVAGHGDEPATSRVQGVPVARGGAEGSALAIADVVRAAAGGREVRLSSVAVSPEAKADAVLRQRADRYRRQVDSALASPVATLKFPLGADDRLAQLIAEARRSVLRTDIGVIRRADVAAGLPTGPVAYRDVAPVQPHGRALLRAAVTGARLREAIERALEGAEPSVAVSGLQVRFDPKRAPGRRVRQLVLADGKTIDPRREYQVALDESLLGGGGSDRAPFEGVRGERSDLLEVDALLLYLRRLAQPVEVTGRPNLLSTDP